MASVVPRFLSLTNVDHAAFRESVVKAVQTLGYEYPTREQLDAVERFVFGHDVFMSLPTGSGKNVCYACLPLVFDTLRQGGHSIVVILSPLSALMQDQVASFTKRGLKCVALTYGTADENEDVIAMGDVQLVFASPEILLSDRAWRDMLRTPVYQDNLVALTVDEAHLVEKW